VRLSILVHLEPTKCSHTSHPPECLRGLYRDIFTFGVAATVSLRRCNEAVLVNEAMLVNYAACFASNGNDNDYPRNDLELVTW